ncbi:unnamed protein product [Adineta ricciae]|uniref:Uncharacterized protein n=1 Tax=Adineta ricciae TaxID=249248 RepID=A0A813TLR3_ADIRI|nr:unnamed protein product [Adineta ricciae]CAF1148480.1 unnamed protein product [Adineta ricciae]
MEVRMYFITLPFLIPSLSVWFLVHASVDRRFLHSSSNANVRRWSSYKVARLVIPLTFLVVQLAYAHVLVFYEILTSPQRTCSIGNKAYNIFLGIWHVITYGTGPALLMLIFSLLTIRHVRQRRVIPTASHSIEENQRSSGDNHLLRMALAQCGFIAIATTIYAVGQWYTTLTAEQSKSSLQVAIDNLFYFWTGTISGFGHATTFFIFTLSSKFFREQLFCRRRGRNF